MRNSHALARLRHSALQRPNVAIARFSQRHTVRKRGANPSNLEPCADRGIGGLNNNCALLIDHKLSERRNLDGRKSGVKHKIANPVYKPTLVIQTQVATTG